MHLKLPLAISSLLLCFSAALADEAQIVFSCSIPKSTHVYQHLETIYRQAFARLGYQFQMKDANPKRALTEAQQGKTDGNCARAWPILTQAQQANLVQIPQVIATTRLSAWSTNPKQQLASAEEIIKKELRVGFPRDQIMSQNFAKRHGITRVVTTPDIEIAIKMLAAGRFDLLITSGDLVRQTLVNTNIRQPIYQVGQFEQLHFYPLLNQKHSALVPALTAELKQLLPPQGLTLE